MNIIIGVVVYIIGFCLTMTFLVRYGKQIGLGDYDEPKDYTSMDDWDSNAQAWLAWSIAWFIFVPFLLLVRTFGQLVECVKHFTKEKELNMKKEIKISVSGVAASGKSRIIYLIKKTLKEHGFEVNHNGKPDFNTGGLFDKQMAKNIDDVINVIKDTRTITIEEVQTHKMPDEKNE